MAHSTLRGTAALSLGAALCLTLSAWPTTASAGGRSGSSGGALSRTTSAVGNATSSSQPASSPSSSSSSSSSSGDTYYYADYGRPYCPTCGLGPAGPGPAQAPGKSGKQPTRLSVNLGIQSVEDSDGALMGDIRLFRNGLGISASATRYFESVDNQFGGTDSIYMNIWELAFNARGLATGNSELWLSAGLGGASSSEFDSLSGAVVGARLEHRLTDSLKALGSVRYFAFREGVRASEYRASVAASFLSFGYRVYTVHEDGAVPLQGPEVGLSMDF